jgi:hypothetical protein
MAQSNLVFNSVKFITLTCVSNGCSLDTTIVIPAGKTWKIESAAGEGGKLKLNGMIIHYSSSGPYHFPIWLPEGIYQFRAESNSSFDIPKLSFSLLEFNITP